MFIIVASKVLIFERRIEITSKFLTYRIDLDQIHEVEIFRIPSLYDEIALQITAKRKFLVKETVDGFFELVALFGFEDVFGPMWYRDAESGHKLHRNISANR